MTMFGLQKCSGQVRAYTGVLGGYRNPPGSIMGLMGLGVEEEGRPRQGGAPFPSSPNWTRRGAAPPFPSLPLSLPSLLLLLLGKEESYSRLARPPPGQPPLPLAPLYTGAGGHPKAQQLIIDLLAVCGAASTIIHLGNIVRCLGEALRR